ncbi:hypothetical protein GCM10027275_23510 [Rhabdobacter roseus]|uniref:Quinol monooxygenase YgiN n=1 Tax=Rhabdobacter roseus TaxID=1655419 RepID=A0A840TL66_9BACT|nr:antibiotic biosynthesis monooxygenase [Rhabdobacter roseus]MBB5284291.1 quinol monooxygenase YgiN [Rhabdobacter roseus]
MLIRLVRMTFRPDEVPTFRAIFDESKQKIRAQPGCTYLELWQDMQQSHVFVTHSHWVSEAALEQYRQSELFRGTWARTKVLFAEKPVAFSAQVVDKTDEA